MPSTNSSCDISDRREISHRLLSLHRTESGNVMMLWSFPQALHEKADATKKHVVLYSSSKKNVPFYERHGYERLRDYGENCTLMYRRYQMQHEFYI